MESWWTPFLYILTNPTNKPMNTRLHNDKWQIKSRLVILTSFICVFLTKLIQMKKIFTLSCITLKNDQEKCQHRKIFKVRFGIIHLVYTQNFRKNQQGVTYVSLSETFAWVLKERSLCMKGLIGLTLHQDLQSNSQIL